jgi:hypothetical protein
MDTLGMIDRMRIQPSIVTSITVSVLPSLLSYLSSQYLYPQKPSLHGPLFRLSSVFMSVLRWRIETTYAIYQRLFFVFLLFQGLPLISGDPAVRCIRHPEPLLASYGFPHYNKHDVLKNCHDALLMMPDGNPALSRRYRDAESPVLPTSLTRPHMFHVPVGFTERRCEILISSKDVYKRAYEPDRRGYIYRDFWPKAKIAASLILDKCFGPTRVWRGYMQGNAEITVDSLVGNMTFEILITEMPNQLDQHYLKYGYERGSLSGPRFYALNRATEPPLVEPL